MRFRTQAERFTGCGSICTACLPDLRDFLAQQTPETNTKKELHR